MSQRFPSQTGRAFLVLAGLLALLLVSPIAGTAYAAPPDPQDKPLLEQLRDLRERLAKLEASVASHGTATPPAMGGMPAPGAAMGMQDMMKMQMGNMMENMQSMMKMMEGMMAMGGTGTSMKGMAPAPGGAGAMPMEGMDGMEMGMGPQPAMTGGTMTSSLPGFPGASHLYHLGASGFFLDHPAHVTLTAEQQKAINAVKEKALLEKASAIRKVEQAEQELWELTSADSPDADKIEAKVREVEKLRADQRLAFIRAVGQAAQLLTDEQRKALAGDAASPGSTKDATKDPHAGH